MNPWPRAALGGAGLAPQGPESSLVLLPAPHPQISTQPVRQVCLAPGQQGPGAQALTGRKDVNRGQRRPGLCPSLSLVRNLHTLLPRGTGTQGLGTPTPSPGKSHFAPRSSPLLGLPLAHLSPHSHSPGPRPGSPAQPQPGHSWRVALSHWPELLRGEEGLQVSFPHFQPRGGGGQGHLKKASATSAGTQEDQTAVPP